MYYASMRLRFFLLAFGMFVVGCCACGPTTNDITPKATPVPAYTIPGGGECVKLGQHVHAPFTNVRVSHDTYLAHSEPMLAENPKNQLNLVGGSKFFTDPAHYKFQIGYFSSFDGGCTWTDGGVLPGFAKNETTSDISFAFGNHNDVYAAELYEKGGAEGKSGISVSKSTDGGKTFGNPVSVFEAKPDQVFSDKPWIAVDQTVGRFSGYIYVVWSYDHNTTCGGINSCSEELAFSRSSDGGKSFSHVRLVEGNAPFCTNPANGRPAGSMKCDGAQGATPVVGPDGTLYVATPYIDVMGGRIPTKLMITTSSDSGNTWTRPVLIAAIHDISGPFPPEKYRNLSLPAFGCDVRSGQLYITWSDKGKRDADILFSTSRDHGQTWSTPNRINDDAPGNGANQFQPQLAVASDGVVAITFFDTRNDPRHKLIDVYLAYSADHGVSFLKNTRVTTQSWDPALDAPIDEYGSQFIGDYQGLAIDDHFAHPFWNDTRTGAQEIFTAAVPNAQLK
jgi:BNR repeat-like domain